MLLRRSVITGTIFTLFFIAQEAVISQLSFPAGGFSIFLILTLLWAALSTPEVAAAVGFGAGIMLDLSPSTSGPLGHWTLILVLMSYAISFFSYGDENMRGNPLSLILMVTLAQVIVLASYLVTGFLLGNSATSFEQSAITIVGSGLWTLVVTPLMLPAVAWLHDLAFDSRMRI
jgi:rod shape-determining protein MreD